MENSFNYTPVRVIGKNHTSLTGRIPDKTFSQLHSFESSLERDFIQLTNFNPNVSSFVEQPLTIEFIDQEGESRKYTPDFLIFYKNDRPLIPEIRPTLVEIKYRSDIKKKWKELKPKFMAAIRHCDSMGWKFKIVTEVEIRTDYLFNAKFLSGYKNSSNVKIEDVGYLLDILNKLDSSTPKKLIELGAKGDQKRAQLLYTIWHMISVYLIDTDLSEKITMNTLIWRKV